MSFLWLAIIFVTVLGTGNRMCKAGRVPFETVLDELVFSAAAGVGLLSYLTLGLGLAGLLYPESIYGLGALLLSVAFLPAYTLLTRFAQQRKNFAEVFWPFNRNTLMLLLLGLFVSIQLFRACAPVTEWDAVYYHLAAPKIYAQQHHISFLPYMINVNYVVGMEMIYTVCLLLQDDTLPQLISVLNSVLLLLTIFAFGKKYLSREAGLLAGLIFYTVPWVMYYTPFAKPDITLTWFATLAVYAYLQWRHAEKPSLRWLSCAAVLAGLAAACKLTGAMIGIILGGWLGGQILRERLRTASAPPPPVRAVPNVRTFGVFALIFTVMLAPWYLKNYVWTGNPVWPYLYGVFGGANWSPEAAAGIYKEAGGDYNTYGLTAFLRIPWDVTLSFKNGVCSPLFLAFLPTLLMLPRRPPIIRTFLLYSAAYVLFWFYITQQMRFLFPIFPILSLATAYPMIQLSRQKVFRVSNNGIAAVFLLFALAYLGGLTVYVAGGVLGIETRAEYLQKRAWLFQEADYINRTLPLTSKIGIFFGPGYYVDREYLYLWPYYQAVVNVAQMQTAADLLRRFHELRITHLVWENPTSRRYLYDDDNLLFRKWKTFFGQLQERGHFKELFRGNDGIVYEIIF